MSFAKDLCTGSRSHRVDTNAYSPTSHERTRLAGPRQSMSFHSQILANPNQINLNLQ